MTTPTFEIANVGWVKATKEPELAGAVEVGVEAALAIDLRWEPVDEVTAFRLSLDTGLSAYDASYLCVVLMLGSPLVTFDRRLATAARALGLS